MDDSLSSFFTLNVQFVSPQAIHADESTVPISIQVQGEDEEEE